LRILRSRVLESLQQTPCGVDAKHSVVELLRAHAQWVLGEAQCLQAQVEVVIGLLQQGLMGDDLDVVSHGARAEQGTVLGVAKFARAFLRLCDCDPAFVLQHGRFPREKRAQRQDGGDPLQACQERHVVLHWGFLVDGAPAPSGALEPRLGWVNAPRENTPARSSR
jgi:hypothetical protein